MITNIIKVLGLIIATSAISVVLKQRGAEYSLFLTISASVIIGIFIFKSLALPINILRENFSRFGLQEDYFKVALKAVGIGYITSFIADSCKDSGQTALASKAEFAGKCAIFLICLPLVISVLETAIGFIQ